MKEFIEHALKYYEQHPKSVVEHLFAVNGNGHELDNCGYLIGNYRSDEVYDFPEPEGLKVIYRWSDNEQFQPFRKYAGCRDVGFKATAQYFIDCIKATPDDVDHIRKWKENLHIVEDVLLNTPMIEPKYTINDFNLFMEDVYDDITYNGTTFRSPSSVRKVWYFDVQREDVPEIIQDEVIKLWSVNELGNHNCMWRANFDEELFQEYPKIYFWLKYKGVLQENDEIIIHWWW